jgi:hypothetical protein
MQKLLIAFMFVKLILSLNSCDLMDEIDSIWGTWGMQNLGKIIKKNGAIWCSAISWGIQIS